MLPFKVGAGTNNARLVAMLRSLASYHHKDQVGRARIQLDASFGMFYKENLPVPGVSDVGSAVTRTDAFG